MIEKEGIALIEEQLVRPPKVVCRSIIHKIVKQDAVPLELASLWFDELLKFLRLAAIQPQFELVPSRSIDAAWHAFILHTKSYTDYCVKNYGFYIHHDPADATSEESDIYKNGYLITRKALKDMFGVVNSLVWPASVDADALSKDWYKKGICEISDFFALLPEEILREMQNHSKLPQLNINKVLSLLSTPMVLGVIRQIRGNLMIPTSVIEWNNQSPNFIVDHIKSSDYDLLLLLNIEEFVPDPSSSRNLVLDKKLCFVAPQDAIALSSKFVVEHAKEIMDSNLSHSMFAVTFSDLF